MSNETFWIVYPLILVPGAVILLDPVDVTGPAGLISQIIGFALGSGAMFWLIAYGIARFRAWRIDEPVDWAVVRRQACWIAGILTVLMVLSEAGEAARAA